MKKETKVISITLPVELSDRIDEMARSVHRTRTAYVRQIIRRYFRYLDTRDQPDAPPIDWPVDGVYSPSPRPVGEENSGG